MTGKDIVDIIMLMIFGVAFKLLKWAALIAIIVLVIFLVKWLL